MARKLSALAELLRAETQNERRSAMRLIERHTGKHIARMIERGIDRTLSGEDRLIAQHLLRKYSGDTMLLALDVILHRNAIAWADVIIRGSRLSLGERLRIAAGRRIRAGRKMPGTEGVERDALPTDATGVPVLWRTGRDMDGHEIAEFYMVEAEHGSRTFRPLTLLSARKGHVHDIIVAAGRKEAITVTFIDPGARDICIEAVTA